MNYTTGEIARKGLLKNRRGEPYTDKAKVSQILRAQPHALEQTKWGMAKMYSEDTIREVNARWNKKT